MAISTPTKPRAGFYSWLVYLDRILRGEATRPADIQQADIKIPILGISVVVIVLAMIYGFCMGIFALIHGAENGTYQRALLQTFASMCKVPLLFVLTLLVTFPSLYVFNALVGSKLKIASVLRLLIASLAVNLAVLASMGPILAFFSVSTPNYSFIVLLNVIVFTIAGVLGLVFLIQTLNRLTVAEQKQLPRDATATSRSIPLVLDHNPLDPTDTLRPIQPTTRAQTGIQADGQPGPLDRLQGVMLGKHVRNVFTCWIVVFGLVGAQMGWVLRPFIGAPNTPFQWFRTRHSNFFEAVWQTFWNLFG